MTNTTVASPPDRGVSLAAQMAEYVLHMERRIADLESLNTALLAERVEKGRPLTPLPRLALTVAETAQALGLGASKAYELVRSGALGALQPTPGGEWIVPVAGIERWLESHGQAAPTPLRAKGTGR